MERLTFRDKEGKAHWNFRGGGEFYFERLDRLAAYEDTGLTPKQIKLALDTLTLFDKIGVDRGKEITDAEADGRLVVLPCKVGTPIWRTHKVFGEASISGETFKLDDLSQYGKTVFLTREEAEAALKKEADNG